MCYLGQSAGSVGGIEDLVVKYREIKSETQSDWMSWLHLAFTDIERFLVGFLGLIDNTLKI